MRAVIFGVIFGVILIEIHVFPARSVAFLGCCVCSDYDVSVGEVEFEMVFVNNDELGWRLVGTCHFAQRLVQYSCRGVDFPRHTMTSDLAYLNVGWVVAFM